MKQMIVMVAVVSALCMCASAADLPPERGVVLDLCRGWEKAGGPAAQLIASQAYSMSINRPVVKFMIPEPRARYNWRYPILTPIDPNQFPIFTFKYRAANLNTGSGLYIVRLAQDASSGGFQSVKLNELKVDGQEHEISVDMRRFKPTIMLTWVVMGVSADNNGDGWIEALGMRFEVPPEAKPEALKDAASIEVIVSDITGKPVQGATITVTPDRLNYARSASTGADGKASVTPIATQSRVHRVAISADGMFPADEPVPSDATGTQKVKLYKSVEFSGTVTDETGEPVENAAVTVYIEPESRQDRSAQRNWTVKSDSQGRWSVPAVPDNGTAPYITVKHPEFLADNQWRQFTPVAKLRDGSAILVLKKGLILAGTVLGPDGKPVPQARVQRERQQGEANTTVKTDDAGHFSFDQSRPEPTVLMVYSPGYAPEVVAATPGKSIEIKLSPGATIKGKVVDLAGKPVVGAKVAAIEWRGHGSIGWNTTTNTNGEYIWPAAPADEVQVSFSKPGYRGASDSLVAGSDKTTTLKMAQKISGTVIDAATNEPIERFTVTRGDQWQKIQRGNWQDPVKYTKGKYQTTFDDEAQEQHVLRVDAEGYTSGISRGIEETETSATIDFKLKKSVPITISVRLPDGKPAAGARVTISEGDNDVMIDNGNVQQNGNDKEIRTNAKGEASFPQPPDTYALAIISDAGYVEITGDDIAKSPEIVLKPWGKIEGIVKIGPATAPAGTRVEGWSDNQHSDDTPTFRHRLNGVTDATGHFVLPKVASGRSSIGRELKLNENSTGFTNTVAVNVESAKTTTIIIGGSGRPVVGQVIVPAELAGKLNWQYSSSYVSPRRHGKYPKLPDEFDEWDEKKRREWYEAFAQSPEGKAMQQAERDASLQGTHYSFRVDSSKTFRIEDVTPDTYELRIQIFGPNYGRSVAHAMLSFTVPPVPGGRSDEPLSIGDVVIHTASEGGLRIGQTLPKLDASTLNGSTFSFDSLKGKFVLLDFRSDWIQGNSEIKPLKAIQEKYASDSRFVLVTAHVADDLDASRESARRNKLTWTQLHLSESLNEMYESIGIRFSPDIFLLSPDGKVIARDLRGDAIAKAVSDALATH